MARELWLTWAALLLCGGCMTGPVLDNPLPVQPPPAAACENPVYVPLGPPSYGMVFEKVLDIVNDYFDIAYTNRYDGRIETRPRIAPGYERFLLRGSPDRYQRALATLQTIQERCLVSIQVADDGGGFFIDVKVLKEMEDLPRPVRATAGAAAFRSDNTVERQYDVVTDAVPPSPTWIPLGRDPAFEQAILQRIKECM